MININRYTLSNGLRVMRNSETLLFYYGIYAECIMGRYRDIREDTRNAGNLYYSSRELKGITVDGGLKADLDKSNKLNTTRVNGALLSEGGNYTVYNWHWSYNGSNYQSYTSRLHYNRLRTDSSGQ